MVGNAKGSMVSTEDLEAGMMVSMDHQWYEVGSVNVVTNGMTVVELFGDEGVHDVAIEVAQGDVGEPIWERG
jgi:hypothetical protein